ncbi:MAG TPA: tetratricopeptide repeat protein, partial [Candidatus Acidoferrum sp.]|nr:tetratricopeptide repeat protein [Candidatus Acidoferrum sp.]
MVMNSRTSFQVTLLALIWFSTFAKIAEGQENAARYPDGKTGQVDLASLMQRAQNGDVKAEYLLGRSYMTGAGFPQNYEEALKWYQKAASRGSAPAAFGLGYLYEQGKGVARDYQRAVIYYTAAAKQGHPTAENNLASMYEHGQGV